MLLDPGCCDPLYRKAIRVSVGAALTVPFARMPSGVEAVGLLERHGFTAVAMSPTGETPLHALQRPERPALLMGSEGPGLAPEVLARSRTVSIPMASGFELAERGDYGRHRPAPAGVRLGVGVQPDEVVIDACELDRP